MTELVEDYRVPLRLAKEGRLSPDTVRALFDYCEVTGLLTWKESGTGRGGYKRRAGAVAGVLTLDGYITVNLSRYGAFLAHRLAWAHHYGAWPVDQLDHINKVRADNSLRNLKAATNRSNHQNRSNNSSGFPGVSFDKTRGSWLAYFRKTDGTMVNIGRYNTPAAASEARTKHISTYGVD